MLSLAGKLGKRCIRWQVVNKPLYDAIVAKYGEALAEFAHDAGVSVRAVQRWIYEGVLPRPKVATVVHKLLGVGVI